MSEPVVCGRESCQHRLRTHNDHGGPDDTSPCLVPNCVCRHFVEPLGLAGFSPTRVPAPTEEHLMNPWENRHPSVKHFGPLFAFAHLPPHLQAVSRPFAELAHLLLNQLKDGPELSAGLRKLVEAKDCAVRQAVIDRG